MDVKKAIITAASPSQRTLPLQTLVDRDGSSKSALRILLDEAMAAGVEQVCLVVLPGDEPAYRRAAGELENRIQFAEQTEPRGYGHAVLCAREFVASDPFLLMVGDHLYVQAGEKRCAVQLVQMASEENCAVSAVQATHESKLPLYGTVGGQLVPGRQGLYQISQVREKPTPTEAEQSLIVPGLRAGHYLCFFGMHVLTPGIMELITGLLQTVAPTEKVHLSAALDQLASRERYLACELSGRRYDIGLKYGLLTAQMALGLSGSERDEVLSGLVELLAFRPS